MEHAGRCSFSELLLGVSVSQSQEAFYLLFHFQTPIIVFPTKTTRNVTVFMVQVLSSNYHFNGQEYASSCETLNIFTCIVKETDTVLTH